MDNRPKTSAPLHTSGGTVTVTARPVWEGQRHPEVSVTDAGAEVMSLSPAEARTLADALRRAADHSEV